MANQDVLVFDPPAPADACMIWLHGLGADARDFVGIIDQLGLPAQHRVRFIFPNAPFMNISVNNGMRMRAWFDIADFNSLPGEDASGLADSEQIILKIINAQIAQGIAADRIILEGFSQGAALSLYIGLRYPQPLGGIIALSGFLPLSKPIAKDPTNKSMPIFIAHGMFDPIVTYNAGVMAHKLLLSWGYHVEWHAYPMEHTVCPEEIQDIGSFVNRVLQYAH